MEIRYLKDTEMPKEEEKKFYLLEVNDSYHLVLMLYERYQNGKWRNEEVYEFRVSSHDLEELLKEIKPILLKEKVEVLYVEEGILDDEVEGI